MTISITFWKDDAGVHLVFEDGHGIHWPDAEAIVEDFKRREGNKYDKAAREILRLIRARFPALNVSFTNREFTFEDAKATSPWVQ